MYRFLQKSVIGLVLGVLAFSPLVFSLQGIKVNEVQASTLNDDFKNSYIKTKGNYVGYSTHEIEYKLISETKTNVTIDYYADDYVGNNKPTPESDGTYKVRVFGADVYFDNDEELEIGYSQDETIAGQKVPKVRAVFYESIRNIKIDNAAFVFVYKGKTPAISIGSIPKSAFMLPIQINTKEFETKGSFRVEGLGSGTDYVAQLVLINKDAGSDVIKSMTFTTGGSNQAGGANYQAEGTIGLTSGTLDQSGEEGTLDPDESMPTCFSWGEGLSVSGCFAQILYYVFYMPTSWLFMVAGMLFDFTFDYSIQSSSYDNSSNFVQNAWALVRDLMNILFIAIMMYIAIGTLLNTSGVDWKKMILPVIIMAVLINFSFFFTRVIIDFGNVTARLFYNSDTINITKVDRSTGERTVVHGMSEVIVSGFDPQRIVLEGKEKLYDDVATKNAGRDSQNGDLDNTTFILITICAVMLNVVGAGIFFKVGLLFVGRVIGLWVQTITSPIAFMSNVLPKGWKFGGISFSSWLNETLEISFMAPIFMIFMYLILLFVQLGTPLLKVAGESHASWIIGVIIPFIFIMMMLGKAKDTATSLAGEIAKNVAGKINGVVSTVGGLAVGGAVGLAAGGAAALGRSTIGKFANSDTGAKLAERLAAAEAKGGISGKFAKLGLKTFDKAKDASFDIRNNKTFGKGMAMVDKNANINVSSGLNSRLIQATPFESRTTGRATQIKEKAENVKKEINRQSKISHVSDSQFKEYHNEQVTRYNKKYEKEIKKKKPANFETMGVDDKARWEADFKKNYEARYGKQFEALDKDAKDSDVKAMRKRVEEERREQLLARLEKKGDDFTTLGALTNSIRDMKNWTKGEAAGAATLAGAGGIAATQGFTGTVVGNTAGVVAGAGMVGAVAGAGLAGVAYVESSQVKKDAYAKAKKDLEKEWKKDDKKVEELEKKVKNDERTLANQIATLNNDASLFVRSVEGLNNAEMRSAVPEIAKIVKDIQESDAYKDIVKEKTKAETERDEKTAAVAAATDDKEKKKLEKELDAINDKIRGFSLEFATVFETELSKKGGDILDITNNLKSKADKLLMNPGETTDQFEKRKQKMLDHVDTLKDVTLGYTQGADRRIRGINNKDKIESRINKNKEALEGMGKPKDDKKGDDKKGDDKKK